MKHKLDITFLALFLILGFLMGIELKDKTTRIMELEQEISYMGSVIDSRAKFNLDK